jgi:hypothetical protein
MHIAAQGGRAMSDETRDGPSLEERVYQLEQFKFRMEARANVYQQMLIMLLMQVLEKTSDPVREAELLLTAWERAADQPAFFPGIDPSYLDALAQEYQDALREIGAFLLRDARSVAPKKGQRRKR